jgi:hypothetical protein
MLLFANVVILLAPWHSNVPIFGLLNDLVTPLKRKSTTQSNFALAWEGFYAFWLSS